MNLNKTIGINLSRLREEYGLTQDDVAKYLNVSRPMINYYESAKREIPLTHLEKLADLYNVEVADLADGTTVDQLATVAFAFRTEGFETDDLRSIADFQKVVKNYLKMQRIKHEEK